MDVSLDNNSEHSGYKIKSIYLDIKCTKKIVNHMKKCKCHSDVTFMGSKKLGCELIDMCKCNWCFEIFGKRGSCESKQKNHKTSDVNLRMSVSIFTAGISTSKIDEFFTSAGLIAPVKSKFCGNYQKLKPFIMDLSEA